MTSIFRAGWNCDDGSGFRIRHTSVVDSFALGTSLQRLGLHWINYQAPKVLRAKKSILYFIVSPLNVRGCSS